MAMFAFLDQTQGNKVAKTGASAKDSISILDFCPNYQPFYSNTSKLCNTQPLPTLLTRKPEFHVRVPTLIMTLQNSHIHEPLASQQIKSTTQQRKRSDESFGAGVQRPSKRAPLTKENLKAFGRIGRQRRNDDSCKPSPTDLNTLGSLTTTVSQGGTMSSTDSRFPLLLKENGILNSVTSAPPGNLDYLQHRLSRSRGTASPTESEYQCFVMETTHAPNEQTMLLHTIDLLKRHQPGYTQVYNKAFDNFPKNVGFNDGLSAAQPDFTEGLTERAFGSFPVRNKLGGAAVPNSENPEATTLPHLAGEWKASTANFVSAQSQAAYDGACMVYGRNQARSFLESPDPTGHAYVQTFVTNGSVLHTFAHYSSESEGQIQYHQYPTSSSLHAASFEDFKKSRRVLRNLQDDAKDASMSLRDELLEKWSADGLSHVTPNVPTARRQAYD